MEVTTKARKKILIVDDSEMNREILIDILEDQFEILEAETGLVAIKMLKKYNMEIALVLLDIVMPEMDGFEVLAVMNKYHWIDDVPVVMISAENSSSYIERAYELGVTDFIARPFDSSIVYRRVNNTIMLYEKQNKLIGMVTDQIYEKEKRSNLMVSILSHVVEFRNGESGLHVLHVQTITELLLKKLAQKTDQYHLTKEMISLISISSALHDIGKISIDGDILNKPGKLTDEEFAIMKTHTTIGASMLEALPAMYQEEKMINIARDICRWHHERYDGKGYPDGLKGEEIPISAQVVSVADVYDALTSERVYKPAFSHEKAMQMIINGESGSFNPLLLECLQDIGNELMEELRVSSVGHSTDREMYKIADEIRQHSELSMSERTMELLEYERTKNKFFAIMSDEVQFEYTMDPPTLIISEWGVDRLGLEEVTFDPIHDEKFIQCFGEKNIKVFLEKLGQATPKNPNIDMDCAIYVNGKKRWCRIVACTIWKDNQSDHYYKFFGKITDIHDTYTEISELRQKASHDVLTGLFNRITAKNQIMERIKNNPNGQYAMVVLDINYFEMLDDVHGHIRGDEVLKKVANTLSQSVRANDIAARVGEDEFMFFLEYKQEYKDNLESVIGRIFNSINDQCKDDDVTVSLGVATSDLAGADYHTLYYSAYIALYNAKNSENEDFCFYDESMKDIM